MRGLLLPLAGLLGLSACGERREAPAAPPPPAPVWVTVAPPGAEPVDPVVGLPPGSRLLVVDPARPGAAPVEASKGMAAAGRACVSHDGARVAFVGKEKASDAWGVWVCAPDGSDRRRAVGGQEGWPACASPAWLPDGRLVYAAVVDDEGPVPALPGAWALHVSAADGKSGTRITFGAGLDLDPSVLADGRVAYSAWLPPAEGRPKGAFALMTVHPDGTGATLLHGATDGPWLKRWPRALPDGAVLYAGGDGAAPTALWRADGRVPTLPPQPVPGAFGDLRGSETTPDGALLVATGRADPARGGGVAALPPLPEGVVAWHAADAGRRKRPQGHLSLVDPFKNWGQLLAVDARWPKAPSGAKARIRHYDGPASLGEGAEVRLVGETPLLPDGSFFARVPPDTPLLVDVLDAEGKPVALSSTPVWVRPRETRACVGCHESPTVGPPNVRPAAVLADAVDLVGAGSAASQPYEGEEGK